MREKGHDNDDYEWEDDFYRDHYDRNCMDGLFVLQYSDFVQMIV